MQVGLGGVIGLALGFLASGALSGLVFGISALDAPSYAAAFLVVGCGALGATYLGATRFTGRSRGRPETRMNRF